MSKAKKIDDGGSIYPNGKKLGMTKREYYAAQAMTGILASPGPDISAKELASDSVRAADALIAALKVTP